MNQTKSKERETVDSILDALISGKVRMNPDGWIGSKMSVSFTSPAEVLMSLRRDFQLYAEAEDSEKEGLAPTLYGDIINARIGGLLVGETTAPGELDRLTKENAKLKDDLKKLLSVATGQDLDGEHAPEHAPYQ
jgi:hypothetical protein